MKSATKQQAGFTLVELLVVLGVIAILTAITIPAIHSARRQGVMAKELSSARQLMTAYTSHAAEKDGDLLPGFGNFPAKDDLGHPVKTPVNFRYPWRLAPYIGYQMRHFWGKDADDRITKLSKGPRESYVYAVSVEPSLGVNAAYVGGDFNVLPPDNTKAISRYGSFCVTKLAMAARPEFLIVLASAAGDYNGEYMSGYFKIEAPNFVGQNWQSTNEDRPRPEDCGHVDFRYNGKAVAAMLDGHVELLDYKQMKDMRRWANQAATANNPTWRLGDSAEPTSSGEMIPIGTKVTDAPKP